MSDNEPESLKVTVSGRVSFIEVPSHRAEALMKYLRSQGVGVSPPEPCCTATDIVVLRKGTNAIAIQALLDQWS